MIIYSSFVSFWWTSDGRAYELAISWEKFVGILEVKQRKINQEEAKVKSST